MKRRDGTTRVPGAAQHGAQRGAALQTRDRSSPWRSRISGAPLHFVARCTASGTREIGRREFVKLLSGAAAAWPLTARAQQSHTVPRIGVLLLGTPASFAGRTQAFVEGLRELGYVEGRTVAIEWKWGQDRVDRLTDLAAELVRSQVDVIVTGGTPAARALKNATRTIPIVMAMVGDPVGAGLVESLGRPGGNASGLSIVATDLSGRRLQLLNEIVPGLSSVAVMSYGANPQSQIEVRETQVNHGNLSARELGSWVIPVPAKNYRQPLCRLSDSKSLQQ